MIRKKDFIEAIGEPDASFEAAVASALSTVRGMEAAERSERKRRYSMIFPAAAAAVILIAFIGFAVNGPMGEKPDPIKAPGALSQPKDVVTPEPTPEITVETEPTMKVTIEPEPSVTADLTPTPEYDTGYIPTATPKTGNAPEATPAAQATLEAEQPYEDVSNEEFDAAGGNVSYSGSSDMREVIIDGVKYWVNGNESMNASKPEYYDLFEKAFGQGLDNILDEGYSYQQTWLVEDGSSCWVVGDGMEQYIICRLFEDEDGVIFMLYLPYSDVQKTDNFMATTPEWLAMLYYEEAYGYIADAIGDSGAVADSYTLNTLTVKVDKIGEPLMVNMSFGMEGEVYISWEQRDSGKMELTGAYVDGLLVYGNDTGFDTYTGTGAETDETAERYALLVQTFNQEITNLYPGYEISRIVQEDDRTTEYYLNGEIMACRVTDAQSYDSEQNTEGEEYASIRLFMPDDAEIVEEFMANAHAWLAILYFEEAPVVLDANDIFYDFDYPLTELMVMASLDGEPYVCKMVFGDAEQCYICWGIDDNGNFRVIDWGMG